MFTKKKCCRKLLLTLLKSMRGEGWKHKHIKWWRPKNGCFHDYRNKQGKSIFRFDVAPFLLKFVVLSFFFYLHYLPCLLHSDKSGYAFSKAIYNIFIFKPSYF